MVNTQEHRVLQPVLFELWQYCRQNRWWCWGGGKKNMTEKGSRGKAVAFVALSVTIIKAAIEDEQKPT